MNRLPLSVAVTSAVSLCVLVLLNYIVSDDKPSWLPLEPGAAIPAAAPSASAAPDSALPSCQQTETSLRDLVDTARFCTTDSDCTLFDFGYPIDCMTSVAKAEITALRHEYRKYQQSCDYRVYYDCPSEPMRRRAVCRQNRCAVSLETVDTLKEQTLEYLGVERSTRRR